MQFRLSTLLLLFVLLWSSLAVFGGIAGTTIFLLMVAMAISIARSRRAILGLLCVVVLGGILLPALESARESNGRHGCVLNMRQLALALQSYELSNGRFPPAYIADKNGRPIHSWRVLILPYLDHDALYRQYDFREPWDGPNNRKLLTARPRVFACPSDEATRSPSSACTNYVAVVGANAAWSNGKPQRFAAPNLARNTILLAEVTGANIPWTDPRDLNIDLPQELPDPVRASSKHGPENDFFHHPVSDGVNIGLADGGVPFLPAKFVDTKKFPDVFKIGSLHEEYFRENNGITSRPIHWPNCIALAVWLASVAMLMFRAIRARSRRFAECRAGEGATGDTNRPVEQSPSNATAPER
jgi:hypothetical protein